jgi:hypothetical protein
LVSRDKGYKGREKRKTPDVSLYQARKLIRKTASFTTKILTNLLVKLPEFCEQIYKQTYGGTSAIPPVDLLFIVGMCHLFQM